MECVLESPILYLQNKLLIDISPFSEPWVKVNIGKNTIKWSIQFKMVEKAVQNGHFIVLILAQTI